MQLNETRPAIVIYLFMYFIQQSTRTIAQISLSIMSLTLIL